MKPGVSVSWSQIANAPLILISGSENYLASRAIGLLKSKLRAEHKDLEVTELTDGDYSPGMLISIVAPSLFASPRLVVFQAAAEGLLDDLSQYLDMQIEDCTVVVSIPNAVGHNGKLKNALSGKALNVICDELKKDSDRTSFVQGEFKSFGVTVEPQAIRLLLAAFANDLGELGAACSQLAASGVKSVSADQVERTFQGRVETNAFKIADAALAGDASEAIRLYRHGFATGIDNVALTAALAMRVRTLAKLFNNANSQAAAIGMAPWQLDKARKELRQFDEQSLIDLVELVAQTDADVKGASRDPEYSVERLILKMARK